MAREQVNNLTSIGLVKDIAPFQLDPEAFSEALNMRVANGKVLRIGGKKPLWTPSIAPMFAQYVVTPSGTAYWVYMSGTKAYAYDFATDADITPTGGDFNAARANDFFGTNLGGIPVFTDGATVPVYWSPVSLAQELQPVPAWPSNYRAKVIRGFGNNLLALGVTKGGVYYPHLVKWSSPADPGAMPASWDESDPAEDAGENPLPDSDAGPIVDGLHLGSMFYIYKNTSTWVVRRIGGRFVFSFDVFFPRMGLIAPHCVTLCNQGQMHFMFTQDNMIVHDGSQVIPLLDRRMREYVFNRIEQQSVQECFVFHHPSKREVWACFPEIGHSVANKAIVWNYAEGAQRGILTEADIDFVSAANGALGGGDLEWGDDLLSSWSQMSQAWAQNTLDTIVVCRPDVTKLLQLDGQVDNDGVPFTALLQRSGLALDGKKRDGSYVVNWEKRKLVTRIYARIEGGPVNVKLGSQLYPDGPITWSATQVFDPTLKGYVDVINEGKAMAVEFSTTDSVEWTLHSYAFEQMITAEH